MIIIWELASRRETGSTCRVGEHRCAGIPPTAFVWLRVPHPLWAFAFFPISQPTIVILLVSRFTFPYFFSYCTSFNSLYFPLCPALSLPKSCWACPLQRTSFHILLPFSSNVLPFSLAFPYPVLPLSKFSWACPLGVPPPAYFFPFTLPSRTVDFTLVFLYWVCLHLIFYWDFPKNFICNYYFFGCSLNLLHQLWLFAFLL